MNDGPGTPTARFRYIIEELEKRFPHPNPFDSAKAPEQYMLEAIDMLIEKNADCICKGNWRAIVKEHKPLLNKLYINSDGYECSFFGIIHGDDDFYYGMCEMWPSPGELHMLSCVGSLEQHGYTPIESLTEEE